MQWAGRSELGRRARRPRLPGELPAGSGRGRWHPTSRRQDSAGASFKTDVDDYLLVLSGKVLDEDRPLRALRPSTLKTRAYYARAAASALVAAGTPIESIKSLADIARLEPIKLILNHMLNRGDCEPRAAVFNVATFLKNAARYRVKVDAEEQRKIDRIISKLAPQTKGLTDKNRRRLMPLNDPKEVRRFLNLPFQMAEALRAHPRRTVVDAVSAQLAVAIAILQVAPLRVRNLAALDLNENLVERGGRVFILIPGEDVKNGMPCEVELPRNVTNLIAWYCVEYRDLLIQAPSTALFAGRGGKPKSPSTLGIQISAHVKRHLGWPVNPHLFRHIAAKLYLDHRPGEYPVVSRVLNPKSVGTTMRAYTGAETPSARDCWLDVRGKPNPLHARCDTILLENLPLQRHLQDHGVYQWGGQGRMVLIGGVLGGASS